MSEEILLRKIDALERKIDNLEYAINKLCKRNDDLLKSMQVNEVVSSKDYKTADVAYMHDVEKLSWNKLAATLNCSVSTVRRKYKEQKYESMMDL